MEALYSMLMCGVFMFFIFSVGYAVKVLLLLLQGPEDE